ncbi:MULTISPECIES: radical SAM protein [unclassified Desulfovibrio]|uniref:radical SAM protein n=1 Tax=unclassified Desulfovibrio TaxID=2593640 RepID=UPI0013EE028B|nr:MULTISPECIES: radical SAM protein [unclassified Desulfovibrio]
MHYTGQIYRPPMESETPLLQITSGCSHNRCAFCTMYEGTPFTVSRMEDIEADLDELRQVYGGGVRRLFQLNGDSFALPTRKLLKIAEMIHAHFPRIETIACYASIRNIGHKSDQDLKELRQAGYNDLYIGLESGWAPALVQMRKGFTREEADKQLDRLKKAGIRYGALLMFGLGGQGNGERSARETANMLKRNMPFVISAVPTAIAEGSQLERMREAGEYTPPTERELIEEELLLLQALEPEQGCYFFGRHPYNAVPVGGYLSEKDRMIKRLSRALADLPGEYLESSQQRGHL